MTRRTRNDDPRSADRAIIATPANLSAQFTEITRQVWCTFAGKPANTNFDGHAHFCQYCGATNHEPLDTGDDPAGSQDAPAAARRYSPTVTGPYGMPCGCPEDSGCTGWHPGALDY